MESLPDRPEASSPPAERRLSPGGNKVQRVSQHARGLVDDLTTWVELRVELAKIELRERVEARANDVAIKTIAGILGALAGLFALFTVAFFFAWLFGNTALGFLTVTVLLGALAGLVYAAQPQLVSLDKTARVDGEHVARGETVMDRTDKERAAR